MPILLVCRKPGDMPLLSHFGKSACIGPRAAAATMYADTFSLPQAGRYAASFAFWEICEYMSPVSGSDDVR